MSLSDKTVEKMRTESVEVGGYVYDESETPVEADVTHFEEDDDPLTLVGEFVEDEKEVQE